MYATYNITLDKLTPAFIAALKEKHGAVNLEIKIHDNTAEDFSENKFWEIIDLLDWDKKSDAEILEPAVAHLSQLPIAHIYAFEDQLTDKLRSLDAQKYAQPLQEHRKKSDGYLSADVFLYTRACVVANGKLAYEEVLAHPELMPKDITFEPLLSLSAKAYFRKTAKTFDYLPTKSYETFANEEWT